MAIPVSKLPEAMLRSRRWGVKVGEGEFSGLFLEQAALLAISAHAIEEIFFELGEEEGKFWTSLLLPHNAGPAKLTLRATFGPASFSFMETNRDWVVVFLSPVPVNEPPLLRSEGRLYIPEKVMGKEIASLSEDKISEIQKLLTSIRS
jgi:hypothetical protein